MVFHWGVTDREGQIPTSWDNFIKVSAGSEHKKSHTAFPMEMQLVHYKVNLLESESSQKNLKEKLGKCLQEGFSDLEAAVKEGRHDSLAVLSIFYSVQLRSLASTREVSRFNAKQYFQVDLPIFDLLIAGLANITQPASRTQVGCYPKSKLSKS